MENRPEVTLFAFDTAQELREHPTPYEALFQVVDGDAEITIAAKPYRLRTGDVIILEMDLSLWPWQAVLGAEVRIETPDGPVTLTVPPGTQSGRRLRVRGRGLPRSDGSRGDLYTVVRIVVPERPLCRARARRTRC